MSTLVSTGQITIVDNNDAKPITAYITNGLQPLQQVYSQNNGVVTYTPSRATSNLVLTAQVYVGSSTDIASSIISPKWCLSPGGTALTSVSGLTVVAVYGSTPTLTISDDTQVTMASPSKTIYFEGDYRDPVTGFLSHLVLQTTLVLVQTGTNATYPQFKGSMFIEQSTGVAKKQIEIVADLIRTSGIDTTNLYYRWYTLVAGTWTPLDQTFSGYATKFGYITAAQTATDNLAGATSAMLNVAIPATMAGNTTIDGHKGIIIDESLVASIGLFKCSITDTLESITYDGYFTITDTSDAYRVTLISTSGEKLQNGVGNTDVYPIVYYGATKVVDLSSWSFTWYYWAVDMNSVTTNPVSYRAAFIDTTRTAQAGGRALGATPNTAGVGSVITYGGTAITFAANDIIKIVLSSGITRFYEVASGTGNTVTIRATATTATWLNNGVMNATPTLNEFANGHLYVCLGTRTTSGGNNSDLAAKINVTGDEIDVKGTILCDAYRP